MRQTPLHVNGVSQGAHFRQKTNLLDPKNILRPIANNPGELSIRNLRGSCETGVQFQIMPKRQECLLINQWPLKIVKKRLKFRNLKYVTPLPIHSMLLLTKVVTATTDQSRHAQMTPKNRQTPKRQVLWSHLKNLKSLKIVSSFSTWPNRLVKLSKPKTRLILKTYLQTITTPRGSLMTLLRNRRQPLSPPEKIKQEYFPKKNPQLHNHRKKLNNLLSRKWFWQVLSNLDRPPRRDPARQAPLKAYKVRRKS